ncbi:putative encoded peptide [Lupinus albus]|uniref:Putative encoded peptide n=1 Tax=Lupinus albus TaxID=3870 RepID=A0A6A4PZT3_LUPAL|nr:putative encoded peptide [Lupinus albus]
MAEKTILLTCFLFLIILQHNFGLVIPSIMLNFHPLSSLPLMLKSPLPPSLDWYTINDDKDGEEDAFRPTSPGHSLGVGHQSPPSAP